MLRPDNKHKDTITPAVSISSRLWEDKMNGTYEHAPQDGSFMFTSESVGEGHPGE